MAIRKLGPRKWQLIWELPRDPLTGERQRTTETFRGAEDEASERWRAEQVKIDRGEFAEPSALTFEELCRTWFQDVAMAHVRATTTPTYESLLRVHIIPALGHVLVQEMKPQHVQRFVAQKLREVSPQTKRLYSPRTVQACQSLIREVLQQAVTWGIVTRNVADLTEKVRVEKPRKRFWTPEDAAHFLETIAEHRLYALFLVALTTTMREGELLGLRWSDVELHDGTLSVQQTLARTDDGYVFSRTKSATSERAIPLGEQVRQILLAHRRRLFEERLAKGAKWQDFGLVFPSNRGTPMSPRNLLRLQGSLCRKASVPYIPIHGLRHTAITALVAAGVDPKTIQERAGHHTASFTMQEYAHTLTQLQRDAATTVEDVFLGGSKQMGRQKGQKQ